MPNSNTFQIKPIKELIEHYLSFLSPYSIIIDPFANKSKYATITNDIDTNFDTNFHMDATDFLKMFPDESVDMILYDPPYSSRQVSECYKKLNLSVNMQTTQSSYWSNHKKQIQRIIKKDGIAISCGWNSNGIGKNIVLKKSIFA